MNRPGPVPEPFRGASELLETQQTATSRINPTRPSGRIAPPEMPECCACSPPGSDHHLLAADQLVDDQPGLTLLVFHHHHDRLAQLFLGLRDAVKLDMRCSEIRLPCQLQHLPLADTEQTSPGAGFPDG